MGGVEDFGTRLKTFMEQLTYKELFIEILAQKLYYENALEYVIETKLEEWIPKKWEEISEDKKERLRLEAREEIGGRISASEYMTWVDKLFKKYVLSNDQYSEN